jgi:ATP-dependent Lon protease
MIAAHRGGIRTVIVPKENEKDLKEIPSQITRAVRIVMVEHMDEVLAAALVLDDPSTFLRQGDHLLEDIFDVQTPPPGSGGGEGEGIPSPAGVN